MSNAYLASKEYTWMVCKNKHTKTYPYTHMCVCVLHIDSWHSCQSRVSLHRMHLCKQIDYQKTIHGCKQTMLVDNQNTWALWKYIYIYIYIHTHTHTQVLTSEWSVSQSQSDTESRELQLVSGREAPGGELQQPTVEPGWVPLIKEAKT